jgi:hypothetical protein
MKISEAAERIGQKVVYRAPHVRSDEPGEEGVITAVSSAYVFVRFGTDVGSKATGPEMLQAVAQ